MVLGDKNLWNVCADLCSLAVDSYCLGSTAQLKLIYSSRARKCLSIDARSIYLRQIMVSVKDDLCSLAVDSRCLDCITFHWCQTWLPETWSMRLNFFTKSLVLYWPSLEPKVITCFIHWILISYYYVSLWLKSGTGGRLCTLSTSIFISVLRGQIWKQIITKCGGPNPGLKLAQKCFCTEFGPVVTSRVILVKLINS